MRKLIVILLLSFLFGQGQDRTTQTYNNFYKSVISITGSSNETLTASLQQLQDGKGNLLPIWVADDSIKFTGKVAIAQDLDAGGYYILNEQGKADHVSNTMPSPYYRFDGSSDEINKTDATHFAYDDTTPFSIRAIVRMQSDGGGDIIEIEKEASLDAVNVLTLFESGGDIYFRMITAWASNYISVNSTASGIDYKDGLSHDIIVTFDGSSLNTGLILYIDGIAYSTRGGAGVVTSFSATDRLRIGSDNFGSYFTGEISNVEIWNNELTAAEVKSLSSGGSVPFKYQGANQTALVTGDDSDMTTVGNWTGSGSTVTGGYDSGDAGHSTTLRIESNDGASDRAELPQANFASATTVGKTYRVSFDYKWIDVTSISNGTHISVAGVSAGSSFTTGTGVVSYSFGLETSWTAGEMVFIAQDNTTQLRIYCNGWSSGDAVNEVLVDNVTLVQIGAVAEYDGSSMTASTWYDKSGNDLDGTVTGASLENLTNPVGKMELESAAGAGSATLTFKSGSGNALTATQDAWLKVIATDGTVYYVPAFTDNVTP